MTFLVPPSRTTQAALAICALASFGTACGASDEDSDTPRMQAFPGCEDEVFAACDVFTADCQQAVFSTVSCLRGDSGASAPPVRSITTTQFRDELLADNEEVDDDTLPIIEGALVLLELATPGEFVNDGWLDLQVETVPAFYSAEDDEITLVESDQEEPPGTLTLTLAHEYTHALQDQQVDLIALQSTASTSDAALAQDCVVEGEAKILESFFEVILWGIDPADADFRTHYMSGVEWAEEQFAEDSPVLATRRYFPYTYGARYVYNVYSQGGTAAVRTRLETPPAGTRSVIASVWELVDAPIDTMDDLTYPAPAEGFEIALVDSLGAWIFQKFLQRLAVPDAVELAATWRGDRMVIYASNGVAALWRLRLDTEVDAGRLHNALQTHPPLSAGAVTSLEAGRDLIIVATEVPDQLSDWVAVAGGPWDAIAEEPSGGDSASDTPAPPPSLARLLGPRWRRHHAWQ